MPAPTPAQIAAPSALLSVTAGTCTGTPEDVGDDLRPQGALGRAAGEDELGEADCRSAR